MRISFLRKLLVVEIGLIFIQAIVGMVVNLYEIVPFPINFNDYAYSAGGAGFGVHHYVAVFVLLFAFLALFFSFRMKLSLLSKLSLLGLALLVGAYGGGTAFVFLQPNSFYSLLMAGASISALVVYTLAIFLVKEPCA